MANPAVLTAPKKAVAAAPAARVPFIRGSYEHVEPGGFDVSQLINDNANQLGPFDIPAYGYIAALWILVEGSGGVIGAGVMREDYPYNVLDTIELTDVNGQPIQHPVSGYELFVENKWGAYVGFPNPSTFPDFDGATINPIFSLRIPIQVTAWDAYGSLANQNSAAAYRCRIVTATRTAVYSTNPTTAPTLRIRGFLEAWQRPAPTDMQGAGQEEFPPGHGSVQFWKRFQKTMASGEQTVQFPHVGNFIRTLAMIYRTAALPAGTRTHANFPDPIRITLDGRQLLIEPRRYRRGVMQERYGYAPDTGVIVYDFIHDQDGTAGNENRHLYLPTVQASRLELTGSFGAAGELVVLTNDVAPVGGR